MHVLVADYLGYKPPTPAPAGEGEQDANANAMAGLGAHAPAMAVSDAVAQQVREAATPLDAAEAFARMHFGELKDVSQI